MDILKQSTAATIVMGPMVDSTDGNTPKTSLTIIQADIRVSKNGGTFAQTNNTAGATHMEFGKYSVPLDATDTGTLGKIRIDIHESGALAVWREFTVVTENAYNTLCSTDAFDVNVISENNIDFGATKKASINAECNTALTDYGANTTTPPTVVAIRTEMDANSTKMAPSQTLADYKAAGFSVPNEYDTVIADIPTVSEFNDRTILAANYFDPAVDTVANVATVTTNSDMRGTENAATATNLATVDTVVDAILEDTGTTIPNQITALNDLSAAEVNTEVVDAISIDTIADSYATDGNQPTLVQAVLAIHQMMQEKAITGTSLSVKKPDGSTTAMTFTLDDATAPTSITRAT